MALTNLEKTILDTIAYYEGTIGRSQNGYDLLFGGTKVMQGWSTNTTTIRHRCIFTTKYLTKEKIEEKGFTVCQDRSWQGKTSGGVTTTAAGRYQYIGSSWWDITTRAGLGSNAPMSKDNQNIAAALSVKNKGVTEEDLSKALNSLTNFKALLEKMKKTWESFERSLNGNYGITLDMGWQFYKATYEKYKNGGGSGTQSNFSTSGNKLFYLDKDGKSIAEFGNNLISTNGDTNKFYFNKPNDSTNKIIYFWAGLEKVIARKTQWNQIPQKIKDNYYIIMAAGVGETSQNPISELKKVVEGFDNSIKVDNLQKVLMGYSAGGYSAFNNYNNTYKFVALMDPSLSSASNTENRTYSNNVAMIWGSSGMKGISDWGTRYPKVQEVIKNGGGFSEEIANLNHGVAIQKWFEKYESNLLDVGSTSSQISSNEGGGSPTTCTYTPTPTTVANSNTGNGGGAANTVTINLDNISSSSAATGSKPNASYLRSVMSTLGYREKSSGQLVVPEKDPTTGEWKTKINGSYVDGELSNGGDIAKELAEVSAALFTKIKEIYPDYKIVVTGGNDKYHQGITSYTSRHKLGRGLDFVIQGEKAVCENDPIWKFNSKKGTKVRNVLEIIRGFSGGLYDKYRYIDEYCNQTAKATGAHIHTSWGSGTEAKSSIDIAKNEVDKGQLSTYGSQDLFS